MIAPIPSNHMNNRRLKQLIESAGDVQDGQLGYWRFLYRGRVLVVVTDESANRMRIMTPVVGEPEMSSEDLQTVLAANFGRAMDAKYALSNEVLWSVFMHRLRELTDDQFLDGLDQVAQLADNYGTTYTSSNLVFDGE